MSDIDANTLTSALQPLIESSVDTKQPVVEKNTDQPQLQSAISQQPALAKKQSRKSVVITEPVQQPKQIETITENPISTTLEQQIQQRCKSNAKEMYAQSLRHVAEYMRLAVVVKPTTSQDSVKLQLTLERTKTVQDLCKLIEAEYAYSHNNDAQYQQQQQQDLESAKLVNSIRVITVHDAGNVSLKFDSQVQSVLNNGDTVHAICVVADNSSIDTLITRRYDAVRAFLSKEPVDIAKASYEVKASLLLHNQSGIQAFQEFCMEDFEIESLLFWLECESFRGLCHAANKGDVSRTHVDPSNKQYETLLLHARYIYLTFFSPDSQLKLNLPQDLVTADSIEWPLPRLDSVSGQYLPLKIDLCNQIQDFVFHHLALFAYPKFEKSRMFKEWKPTLNLIETRSGEPLNLENGQWIRPDNHHIYFPQDLDGMDKAIGDLLNNQTSAARSASKSASRRQSIARKRQSVISAAQSKRQSVVSAFSAWPSDENITEYYGQGPKITYAQRLRRIARERALKDVSPTGSRDSLKMKQLEEKYVPVKVNNEQIVDSLTQSSLVRLSSVSGKIGSEFEKQNQGELVGEAAADPKLEMNNAHTSADNVDPVPLASVRKEGSASLLALNELAKKKIDDYKTNTAKVDGLRKYLDEHVVPKLPHKDRPVSAISEGDGDKKKSRIQKAKKGIKKQKTFTKNLQHLADLFGESAAKSTVDELKQTKSIQTVTELLGTDEILQHLLSYDTVLTNVNHYLDEKFNLQNTEETQGDKKKRRQSVFSRLFGVGSKGSKQDKTPLGHFYNHIKDLTDQSLLEHLKTLNSSAPASPLVPSQFQSSA